MDILIDASLGKGCGILNVPDDNNINSEPQREVTITASSVDLGVTVDEASEATLVTIDNESEC